MGIDTSAKLIYGATYEELSEVAGLEDMLDNGEISYASPYYDSDRESWIIGVEMPSEVDGEAEMVIAIRGAKAEFEKLTGTLGRIIVSADVT